VPSAKIPTEDVKRICDLYEMAQRATHADDHSRNESAAAFIKLSQLFAKYGIDLSDIPAIQLQHQKNEAAKSAKTANAAPSNKSNALNVLELVHYVLQGYVDMQPHEFVGVTLWALHTHVFDRFQIAPRLAVLSPVRGCGKSKLLLLLEKLVANPERHDNATAASLYRIIEQNTPTLLLDEGDNLGLKIDRVMRSVLNSGHLKGGKITRVIRNQPRSFDTFGPAAIGAIGTLTLPLLHRAIVILLHRTLRDDLKTMEMMQSPEETRRFEGLRREAVTWAQRVQFDFDPKLPKILRGRIADNWRPLIAIADSFHDAHWSEMARDAAIVFADGYHDEDACVALLVDIRTIFRTLNVDRIRSAVLAVALHELETGAGIWSAWRGENDDQSPHPITQGEIASLLRRFDPNLRPRTVFELGSRKDRGPSGQGYYANQFEKWWAKYCPEDENDSDNIRQLRAKSK
jgi:hypothetical protein